MPASRPAAALGFTPHSGWAALVAIGPDQGEPRVLLRSRVEMFDPRRPESKQPYHAVEELAVAEAARRLERWMATAQDMARAAIEEAVTRLAGEGWRVTAGGILDSSGRRGVSLEAILASHALIHTADGDHYREALTDGLERNGLKVSRVAAKGLDAMAASRLRRPAPQLAQAVKGLGRQVGPPWGADQKSAALLAWMLLER
jgi:hypothetical protein